MDNGAAVSELGVCGKPIKFVKTGERTLDCSTSYGFSYLGIRRRFDLFQQRLSTFKMPTLKLYGVNWIVPKFVQ